MEIDGIKALSFVLVFVPGYIFIHTLDYHLIKGEKSQFEKTVQAILASTVLWTIFIIFPYQPLNDQKEAIINLVILIIKTPDNKYLLPSLLDKLRIGLVLFLLFCFYSFFITTFYAILRKTKSISRVIQIFTTRDYFKQVALRFYTEGFNKLVLITMKNKNRYLGYLIGAPDQESDHKIILHDPYIIENSQLNKLWADRLLIDTNDVDLIEMKMKGEENDEKK